MKITRPLLRNIIREYYEDMLAKDHVDGTPWSGSLEDLAKVQSKTWGHGDMVDSKGWKNNVKLAKHFTNGTATSAKAQKLSERFTRGPAEDNLRRSIVAFVDEYMLTMGMNPGDITDVKRTRRTIDDIVGTILGG